jgi:hypothetical protein
MWLHIIQLVIESLMIQKVSLCHPQVKGFSKWNNQEIYVEEPLWDHVQSFTLNDHIIGTLDHQLFEQDDQTLSAPPHSPP